MGGVNDEAEADALTIEKQTSEPVNKVAALVTPLTAAAQALPKSPSPAAPSGGEAPLKPPGPPPYPIFRDDIKPGDDDGCGNKLKNLIFRSHEFCVWIIEGSFDVWWHYEPTPMPKGLTEITSRVAQLEAVQIHALRESARLSFRCLVGEGLARALEGDIPAARSTLDSAESFVKARLEECARKWHLLTALAAGVIALTALILLGLFNKCGAIKLCAELPVEPVYCGLMGVLGAIFSVSIRANKISADPAAGFALHLLEVLARIVTGGVAGFLACLAILAGLLLPQFQSASVATFLVMGFVAGMSERLIPNLVSSVESQGLSSPTPDKKNAS